MSSSCGGCQKTFANESALSRHQRRTTSDACRPEGSPPLPTFPCSQCTSILSRQEYLTQHIRAVHGAAEDRIPCPVQGCTETFTYTSSVRSHVQVVHEKKRRFMCTFCEHGFGSRFNLERHEEVCQAWTPEVRTAYLEHHRVFISKIGAIEDVPDITHLTPLTFPPPSPSLEEEGIEHDCTTGPLDRVACTVRGIELHPRDFRRLDPGMWLNDTLIDAILQTYQARVRECWVFTTYFYPTFVSETGEYRYSDVQRWTVRAKVNLFTKRLILFPIHVHGVHWTLVVANVQQRTLTYYDSMGADGSEYLHAVLGYLQEEHRDKEGVELFTPWSCISTKKSVPQQPNDVDCGVFVCTFARLLMEGHVTFPFSYVDIPRIRTEIKRELLRESRV
jgi:hypothetical protein